MIPLDILSDPICPWCYIGWSHLARAMESRPDHPFTITWHPFQLNPDMPSEGMDRRVYLETKFGGQDAAVQAYLPVSEHAERAGLNLKLDQIPRTPNTLDAHRLIHWAGLEGRQTPTALALFRAYFQDGRDIGDPEVLADIAHAVGFEDGVVARLLASDADRDDIRKRDAHSRQRGVSAVPTFVIANQHVLSGAQPPELWIQVIDDIAAQLASQSDAGAAEPGAS